MKAQPKIGKAFHNVPFHECVPMTAVGHSRRTEEPRRLAECPLCFHPTTESVRRTKRREVPGAAVSTCSKVPCTKR
jgi:hypothetical protein